MGKKAFAKIAEGLQEAVEIARGVETGARMIVPAEVDVKAIRSRLKMSQTAFASAFGFTPVQIKDWEQGRSRPLRSNRTYLMLIDSNPRGVLADVRKAVESYAIRAA